MKMKIIVVKLLKILHNANDLFTSKSEFMVPIIIF